MKICSLLSILFVLLVFHAKLSAIENSDGKSADMSKPVQVFIIMGQSNTLEMGKVKGDKEGSLEYAVQKENLYSFMVDELSLIHISEPTRPY